MNKETKNSPFPEETSRKIDRNSIIENFKRVRAFSQKLCEPLKTEDFVIQSMPDVSPTKWHLAHTSWLFEAFILSKANINYTPINPIYNYLFNSYYVLIGDRFTRAKRGLLSRPTVKEIYEYRSYIDAHLINFIENCSEEELHNIAPIVEIGLNHEQQHQELLITDIKHVFSINPLHPIYIKKSEENVNDVPPLRFISFHEGIYEIGDEGKGFVYDNETPQHKEFVNSFNIGSRLIINQEFIEFINAGGYKKPELWLFDGFATVEKEGWEAPLYWEKINNEWWNYKLTGFEKVKPEEPVCHVSFYEADAFARWIGARLPTEAEWEVAANEIPLKGNFVETNNFHPVPFSHANDINLVYQMYGDVWEWTQSSYSPYPGYKPLPGAVGEYNGKFMSNQIVLKGGSCATSISHIRKTYRNFFYPDSRWQFMGIRLARDN